MKGVTPPPLVKCLIPTFAASVRATKVEPQFLEPTAPPRCEPSHTFCFGRVPASKHCAMCQRRSSRPRRAVRRIEPSGVLLDLDDCEESGRRAGTAPSVMTIHAAAFSGGSSCWREAALSIGFAPGHGVNSRRTARTFSLAWRTGFRRRGKLRLPSSADSDWRRWKPSRQRNAGCCDWPSLTGIRTGNWPSFCNSHSAR